MYLYNKVSCICCRKEYSIKGIHSHYLIAHTKEGKQRHKLNSTNASVKGGLVTKHKFEQIYNANPSYCMECHSMLLQHKKRNKFCGRSCAAKYNNRNKDYTSFTTGPARTIERAPCAYCGSDMDSTNKYCSKECLQSAKPRLTLKERRAKNAEAQSAYRARYGYNRKPALTANRKLIREIYANCPEGYEVDHIIPLSKGGLHHEDNLQYLTIAENRSKGNKIL